MRFYHENTGVSRYEDVGFACDCLDGLSDNVPANMPVFKKCINHFVPIFFRHDVRPVTTKSVHDFLSVIFVINKTLFSRTDNTIVKRTAGDDFFCRCIEINKSIQDYLYVTRSDTKRGFARRVSRFHHGHSTRGHHDITSFHQLAGLFDRGFFNHLNQTLRNFKRGDGLDNEFNSCTGALFCFRVRSYDDGVLRF